jgi:hypothetical protein
MPRTGFLNACVSLLIATTSLVLPASRHLVAQTVERAPTATLVPATNLSFDSNADSNSPAVWDHIDGRQSLFLITSVDGWPTLHIGNELPRLTARTRIEFHNSPVHGVWMEAIVPDVDGTWYGYYHNELPARVCDDDTRTIPRIGAARSRDFGETWEDLGVILEAPRGWHDCDSPNRYFVGGVGDFSVALDHDQQYLFFFVSQYGDRERTQGVAVGRLPWAYRDQPAGRMSLWWRDATWVPTIRARRGRGEADDAPEYAYPAGVPIYRVQAGWHNTTAVDAFWGPSVHWNTHLQQWVMLLNRARDAEWAQEGIYIAFSRSLSDPNSWSVPQRVIAGGLWYPQVIGLDVGQGTDRLAGEFARFFMGGRSQYFIHFAK